MEATRADDVAAEAERIFKHAHHTHYQHDPVINPRTGTYDVDCSAFVAHVLEVVAREHLALLTAQTKAPNPRAVDFYEFFASPSLPAGWKRVATLADVRRGDVVAWRLPTIKPGEDTGHVFVVAQTPDYNAAAGAWVVHVYDSSNIIHYDDSRDKSGKYHSGVGTGAIRFQVDDSGAPTKFQFGPGDKFHALPMAVARLERIAAAPKTTEHGAHEQRKEGRKEEPRHGTGGATAASSQMPSDLGSGHRIARAAKAGEHLGEGEFAFATYVLAAQGGMLLAPTTFACWGPRQTIPASVGSGSSTYLLAGGVVFRNF